MKYWDFAGKAKVFFFDNGDQRRVIKLKNCRYIDKCVGGEGYSWRCLIDQFHTFPLTRRAL